MDIEKNRHDLERRLKEVGLTLRIYEEKPPKYVRLNPRKRIPVEELEEKLKTKLSPVMKDVFVASGLFQEEQLFRDGYYYIQDMASMMPVSALSAERGTSVLDMCAAPGMKSCTIFDMLGGHVNITAVEKSPTRFRKMFSTFRRYGVAAEAINADAVKFLKKSGRVFDRILLDPSCSGEGMTTKYKDVLQKSEREIKRLADAQLRLLRVGFAALKPGGFLVYSTCALNKTENEDVIKKFLEKSDATLDLPTIPLEHTRTDYGLRIVPGKTRGLFLARLRKVR